MSVSAAVNVEARVVPGPTRSANALMLKVHADASTDAREAIGEAAAAFRREHARPGNDIRVLVITLCGAMGAAAFASGWQALVRSDASLGKLLDSLAMAEVMSGAPSGQVLERVSLARG